MNDRIRLEEENTETKPTKDLVKINYSFSFHKSLRRISQQNCNLFRKNQELKSADEYKDQLANATDEMVEIFYQMESYILRDGCVPFDTGYKLKILKEIILLCKTILCLPGINQIDLPEELKEEYSSLLSKTNIAIESVEKRIVKIKQIQGSENILSILEKNLMILIMLKSHYYYVLELYSIPLN